MIKKLSKKTTQVLINKNIIQNEENKMYEYCVELAIVSLISYLALLSIAIIFNEITCSLLFLVSFSLFRRLNGGYHASSYSKCAMISLSCYMLMIFIIKNLEIIFEINYLLLIVGLILVILISPQQDDNKPLTKRQYHLLKIISRNIATILITVLVLLREYSEIAIFQNKFVFSISYAIDLAAISLLMSKLERSVKNEKI
ncbi:accessory gene regulator B family protein [bacterium]|nr:accessory gene regulator B family protein [bacterium]